MHSPLRVRCKVQTMRPLIQYQDRDKTRGGGHEENEKCKPGFAGKIEQTHERNHCCRGRTSSARLTVSLCMTS